MDQMHEMQIKELPITDYIVMSWTDKPMFNHEIDEFDH